MSECPRCGVYGGGTDRTGHIRPNHMCRHNQFDVPIGYAELDPERLAEAQKFHEECQEIVARGRAEMAEAAEAAAAAEEAEERRQQQMRDDHQKFMEQLRRDAELAEITHKLTYGGRC